MRPFTSTITLAEALAIAHDAAAPTRRTERVILTAAAERVVADALVAAADVPPFDRAVMDGYAVRARDTIDASADRPARLRIVGVAFTGDVPELSIRAGECVSIATGAPLPDGADAVVMVEQTTPAGSEVVQIQAAVQARQNVGRRGGDIAAGEVILARDVVLTPARLGAAAAAGRTDVEVYARPRVFVASTGNEIVEPGAPLKRGQIYDINRFTLPAVIQAHGGEAVTGPTAADTLEALRHTLDAAASAGADLVVLSGGSSVGDRDLLVDAVRERGQVLFHGIAVKPGKPTLLARVGDALVLGMPGNPTSCLSNAYILLIPLLRRLARLPPWRPQTRDARLAADVKNSSGRHTFFTVRLEEGRAVPAFKGSGEITSLANADGYIDIPSEVVCLNAGTVVTVTLF
jgi:molybdenum cofactor synthesis domain-containing protein